MTLDDVLGKVTWKLDRLRTVFYRKASGTKKPAALLRERILARTRELGKVYEDGNSDLLGYTYHPIPFEEFGTVKSHRAACDDRLQAILGELTVRKGDWILDVGANVGYFSFSLEEKGALVEAYEANSDSFEIGAALSKLYNRNVLYINKTVSQENVRYLRQHYRAILLLSVFHWILKQEGEEGASRVLQDLARRCDAMFFEVPCDPNEAMFSHAYFSSQESVEQYLRDALPGAPCKRLSQDERWGKRFLYKIDCAELRNAGQRGDLKPRS